MNEEDNIEVVEAERRRMSEFLQKVMVFGFPGRNLTFLTSTNFSADFYTAG